MKVENHYKWLESNLPLILERLEINEMCPNGLIVAHGDKCYSYADIWKEKGIPFHHGVAIYLLSYLTPYSCTVRETLNGWVAPCQWVIDNYNRFKPVLPE